MKKNFLILATLGLILSGAHLNSQTKNTKSESVKYKKSWLIYGPKSSAKVKDLFFTKTGFKLPQTVGSINSIAGYTSFEPIEGAGNIYTWDFTNGFQISVISETGGKPGSSDLISLVSFNFGGLNSLELGNGIILHKSTLFGIQKIYANKLVKYKNSAAYKMNDGNIYVSFYFNTKNILTSLSISNYDLEI
ncbi:hypothetical protein O2K51_08215 [Apibacter raozihei]|uniref:hypothetical protein n=1 Tax=Apibacter raozihei TaxID=2500547 RepID=UPI000FE369D1|nr:hypothetical protein [Apibacter raozihei]